MTAAEVTSVTYREDGQRTVCVECPLCGQPEKLAWPINYHDKSGYLERLGIDDVEAHCGGGKLSVLIPLWASDVRFRTGYRKYPQRPHSVVIAQPETLNDDAFGEPEHNWLE